MTDLHRIPQRLVDDAQGGLVADDPFSLRVQPRLAQEATALVGHLDPASPIEDASTDIDLVVEDALAERHVARQRRGIPDTRIVLAALAGAGGGDAFGVERVADLLEAASVGVELEDPSDQRRLLFLDGQAVEVTALRILASDDPRVAQDAAAGCAAAARLALQTTPGRVGDAHSLLLADDPLEREHEVVDAACSHGVDDDIVHLEQLDHMLEMFLVAPQPVDVFDDDDFCLAARHRLKHRLQARAFHRRAGDAVVAVERNEFEAVPLGIGCREHPLVIDRRRALVRVVEALAAIANRALAH